MSEQTQNNELEIDTGTMLDNSKGLSVDWDYVFAIFNQFICSVDLLDQFFKQLPFPLKSYQEEYYKKNPTNFFKNVCIDDELFEEMYQLKELNESRLLKILELLKERNEKFKKKESQDENN